MARRQSRRTLLRKSKQLWMIMIRKRRDVYVSRDPNDPGPEPPQGGPTSNCVSRSSTRRLRWKARLRVRPSRSSVGSSPPSSHCRSTTFSWLCVTWARMRSVQSGSSLALHQSSPIHRDGCIDRLLKMVLILHWLKVYTLKQFFLILVRVAKMQVDPVWNTIYKVCQQDISLALHFKVIRTGNNY